VSDLDRDGALDAVTANRDGASLTALLGDGSGGFASSASIDLGGSPYDLVTGDFDGDGLPDLAVVLFEQGRIEVLLGEGDGGFSGIGGPALFLDYGSRIIAADLDRDGRADLAVSADDVLTSLLGNGDGTFRIGPVFSASAPVGDLAVSDLDEDGNPDVVGTDGGAESRIVVLLGDGTGAFTEGEGLTATHVTSLTIADLDGDGHQDVVLRASAGLVWARGDGQGRFEPPRRAGGVSSYLVRPGIVVGDMNGDGANDAVLAGESGPGILLADCPGEFSRPRSIPHEYPLGGTAAGDFDEDGRLDLALTDQGENSTDWGSWTVRLGTGTGDFGDPVVTEVEIGEGPPRPMLVYVADMNLDGHEDLVLGGGYSSVAHVLVGDGTGSFEVLQDCSAFLGVTQRELSIRDFNGDGWPDVAGLGWGYDRLCVVLSDGSGGFLPVSNFDTDPNSIALVDIDVDQDGDLDLALSQER
jgi:hypothetical protein